MEQDIRPQTPMKLLRNAVRPRSWIEIRVPRSLVCFVLVTLILVALIATLGTWTGAAGAEPLAGQKQSSPASAMQTQSQSYEGVITDTHCGAKHSAAIGMAAADCTRVCVHGGEQFALVDGENVYVLEGDLKTLKRAAGQRVRIVGTLNGSKISVATIVTD